MKKNLLILAIIAITGCLFVGCANLSGVGISVATREVTTASAFMQGDLVEDAITIAREVNFPPATKIDKENGIVEFGHYEGSQMGITAQVRVKSPTVAEVTVKRLTAFVKMSADAPAAEFTAKLKAQLGEATIKAIQ